MRQECLDNEACVPQDTSHALNGSARETQVNHATTAAEKAAILSHYSTQAALASDAALYGPHLHHPLDPRTPDPEGLTEYEADEQATDELVRTPYNVAWWLNQTVGNNTDAMPACTESIWQVTHSNDVRRLLVLLMDGNNAQIINAAKRLRELYVAAHKAEIAERSRELLKEQA